MWYVMDDALVRWWLDSTYCEMMREKIGGPIGRRISWYDALAYVLDGWVRMGGSSHAHAHKYLQTAWHRKKNRLSLVSYPSLKQLSIIILLHPKPKQKKTWTQAKYLTWGFWIICTVNYQLARWNCCVPNDNLVVLHLVSRLSCMLNLHWCSSHSIVTSRYFHDHNCHESSSILSSSSSPVAVVL